MVQLASYTSENLISKSLFKLRYADLKYKRVVVAHDLSSADREECKRLVALAKTMAEQDALDAFLYSVRGNPGKMGIVKINRRY